MKTPFKIINFLVLPLLLTALSCNNDDDPVVINLQDLEVSIDENPTTGQVVGTVLNDGTSPLSYSITSQTPTGALSINSSSGELTVADATLFDFETNPIITAIVGATEASNTALVTINLNNENELTIQDFSVAIDENPTDGQSIGTVQAIGEGTLTYSITTQTPAGALSINANTGELTVIDPNLFDFETNPVITATISVSYVGNSATAIATITLNDVDEISVEDLTVNITENAVNGQVVGTLQASASSSLTYTITFQNPSGAFNIDQNTGELSVADETLFDFEINPNMLATISIDNGTYSVSANAFVALNDLNEIGEYKFGGVIFWIDPTSNNSTGLVCTITDINNGSPTTWSNGVNLDIVTSAQIGTGQANTTAIVNLQGTGNYAAYFTDNLTLNNYSDWYLPSVDELVEMYQNRTIINTTALANGGTSFNAINWSSTQSEIDRIEVIFFVDNQTYTSVIFKDFSNGYIRAIRAFTDF